MNKKTGSGNAGFPLISQQFLSWLSRPLLMTSLLLSIPAFYLLLIDGNDQSRFIGHALYGAVALIMGVDTYSQWHKYQGRPTRSGKMLLDTLIIVGCAVSAFSFGDNWNVLEWFLRLGLCAAIVLRIATLVLQRMRPSHLVQMIVLAVLMLTSAGAGFYWLEPSVLTYADGIWLAFSTIATVGYGDIVPSTWASKIFAVFIVLLGYAMFSIVTASIAALFVGEEEAKFERELHADIRSLRHEVAALREELRLRDQKHEVK
ncbi:potassium channel family protein [Undibacterium sp. Rencai35W]|uniref:potassium channel family protein n=1 Tax=Undibacterium sp. Rencai35W TaxID=3413046 RepID=UPI003BF306F3